MISSIICLGPDWYSASKVSTHQIVDCFYQRGMKVLWINPVPVRFPSVKRPDFWDKVKSKARTHTHLLANPQNRLYVYSPIYLPVFSATAMQFNRLVITAQVMGLCHILRMHSPLIFCENYTAWYALPELKRAPSVFHFADKISAFRETSSDPEKRLILDTMETELIQAAGLLTCSSQNIYKHVREKAGKQADKVLYLPHAVNASLFRSIVEGDMTIPVDLKHIPKPIAGYFGSIGETTDKSTFIYAAQHCPDWSFVFIGNVVGDYSELARFRNVYFLGQKPYEEIPVYGKFYDVCFMGRQPHEWLTNSAPIKTLEYLALGKPVVSSNDIPELEKYAQFIRIARTPEEFVAALRDSYAQNTPQLVEERLEFVSHYSWDARVDTLLQALNSRMVNP